MSRRTRIMVPLAPLTDYIDRKYEGIEHVPGLGVGEWVEDEHRESVFTYIRTEDEQRRYDNLFLRLWRARKTGELTLHIADDICCTYLRVHPMAVYGMEWFDFEPEQLAPVIALPEPRGYITPDDMMIGAGFMREVAA